MGKTFFSDYGFRIIFIVVFLLSFIWMGTKRTLMSNTNNVADWLPETFTETQEYKWFLEHFPFESFVVVSWEGCTLDDPRLEMFAQKLVPGQTIDNMTSWMSNVSQLAVELDLQDDDSVRIKPGEDASGDPVSEEAQNTDALPTHYFKNVLTGPRLRRFLQDRYGPKSANPMLSEEQILDRLNGVLIGPDRTAPDGTPLPVGKYKTAMIITLNKPANEKELRVVLETIRRIGMECDVEPSPKPDVRPIATRIASAVGTFLYDIAFGIPYDNTGRLTMGGPPVDNVAIGYEGERTLYRLAGICAAIGLTISMICFRSMRLTMFVFWTAILAAGISLAMVSLTGSRCDAIMLSMPALVYVLAMSGAIHIVNYYHEAIREKGLPGAAEKSIALAWYPCFVASLTTAIGLGSLYFSHLIPIMKFGLYSAIGVMFTLFLLFLYLPSLLHFFPSKKYAEKVALLGEQTEETGIIILFWKSIGGFVIRNNIVVMLVFLAMMVYFFIGVFDIKTSVKMMRFYSPNAEIIAHYGELEETLGPLVPMEVVIKFDNKRCKFNTLERLRFIEKVGEALQEQLSGDIGGLMSATTMTPPTDGLGKAGSGSRRIREYAINGRLEKYRAELKDYVTIEGNPSLDATDPNYVITLRELGITEADADRLRQAGVRDLKGIQRTRDGEALHGISAEDMAEYREKAGDWEKSFGTDIWRISLRVWSLKKDIDYALFVNDVQNVVNPLIDEFIKERFPNESFPEHEPLLAEPKKGILGTIGDWCGVKYKSFMEMIGRTPEVEAKPDYPVKAVYTGMVPVVYKTQHELIAGLVDSLVSAFVLITVVMAVVLKSPMAGLLAMVPNLFPVVIVFGFMGHLGILVDVGTMMTASVAMGIAVDDTMHFLTWFRAAIDQGCTPKEATIQAYKRCATAMTQTTLIGGLGLAAFAFSTFTPTQMFGVMMLAMLSVALIGDLIFLPSILTGPAGRFFIPKRKTPLDLPEDMVPDMHQTQRDHKPEM